VTPRRLLRSPAGILGVCIIGACLDIGLNCTPGLAAQPDLTGMTARVAPCTACHGKEGRATPSGYFPRIAGKPAGYLRNQLVNFREGRRYYAPMTYLLEHLSDAYLAEIAQHFSELDVPYPPPPSLLASPALRERGQALALEGDAERGIPACAGCHGRALTGAAPYIPGRLGLPPDYLAGQLGAWKNGQRRAAKPDCMAQIAAKLVPEEVAAVSAWMASQAVPDNGRPRPAGTEKLPMRCGSVPESASR
jgi:cytochrome c553